MGAPAHKQSPLDALETPRTAKAVAQFLTPEQVERLIPCIEAEAVLKGDALRPGEITWLVDVVRFAVYTGLRRGELCNLQWSAVDLASGFLTVRNSADFRTKSGHERAIPISKEARKVLERLRGERTGEGDDYVFKGANGEKLEEQYLSKRFRYFRRKAGRPEGIRFHSLRHTCASWIVMGACRSRSCRRCWGTAASRSRSATPT